MSQGLSSPSGHFSDAGHGQARLVSLPNLCTSAHRRVHAHTCAHCSNHSWKWVPGDEPQRSLPARESVVFDQYSRVTEVPLDPYRGQRHQGFPLGLSLLRPRQRIHAMMESLGLGESSTEKSRCWVDLDVPSLPKLSGLSWDEGADTLWGPREN